MSKTSEPGSPLVDEPGFLKGLRALDRAIARVEEAVLAVLLLTLILLAVYQAYKRNLSPPSPYWPDELIRYSVFGIGLIGGALAAQGGKLINIDMLTRLFSPRGRLVIRVLTTAFTVFVCVMLVKGGLHVRGVNMLLHEEGEVITPATIILALPIAAILIAVHMTIRSIGDIYYLVSGKEPPKEEMVVA
jgi:TRAP-type C4-dicarboxylate transport system permease small subunit